MKKEQLQQCLDDLLRSFAAYEHEEGLPPAPDGRHHLDVNHTNYLALLTALRWAEHSIHDFEPKGYCVMCGTALSTSDNDNALCDYHLRLKTSGLVCTWGYEDSDGWEFYCAERVFKDGYCEHHYTRMQETPEDAYSQMVKALDLMRGEANEGNL
ncbi:MAG TPA: hypothetical protein VGS27_06690 [Candidatus Sulfotelmatobacter sp.]|nr:hypothetical protein [Candidatus Sulfotelmatobacter sp.]